MVDGLGLARPLWLGRCPSIRRSIAEGPSFASLALDRSTIRKLCVGKKAKPFE